MSRFSQRSTEEEIMDDLNCDGDVVDQTLRELEVINKLLGGNYVTINGLNKIIGLEKPKTLKIVDLGCGGGDILKLIAKWGRRKKIELELIGIDANPNIIEFAKQNTVDFPEISYLDINIFSAEFKDMSFDIATATLFTHHFSDDELANLLGSLKGQAKVGVIINDIHRHWFAYHSIKMLTSLFSKSDMVKNDAAVSVLRSFRKSELKGILKKAKIRNYGLRWMWAFRWQVIAHS